MSAFKCLAITSLLSSCLLCGFAANAQEETQDRASQCENYGSYEGSDGEWHACESDDWQHDEHQVKEEEYQEPTSYGDVENAEQNDEQSPE